MSKTQSRTPGVVLAALALFLGVASPASADDDLSGKSSAELVTLLPDDAAPPGWKVTKTDMHGRTDQEDQGSSCELVTGDIGEQTQAMASLVAKSGESAEVPSGIGVIYGKESDGYDAVQGYESWARRCAQEKAGSDADSGQFALVDGPDTGPDPSVSAAVTGVDLTKVQRTGFVTVARVRGIIVMVIATDKDRDTAEERLDHAVQAALTKLREA